MMTNDLGSDIKALLTRRAEAAAYPPPALAPGDNVAGLDAPDDDELTRVPRDTERGDGSDYAGLTFLLEYADGAGKLSKRRITLNRITEQSGQVYAKAYCHERRALRSFRADRMVALTDLRDGCRHDRPLELLEQLAGSGFSALHPAVTERSGQRQALARCRDGIRVLMFLARCDGAYHSSERQAIAEYCRMRAESERWGALDYDVNQLLEYADRQYPDQETFLACVERITEKAATGEHVRTIVAAAHLLAAADGQLTDAERQFGDELMAIVSKAGFEFRVRLEATSQGLQVSVEDLDPQ